MNRLLILTCAAIAAAVCNAGDVFSDAKSWHDYVRGEQAASELAVSRIFKAMVDSKLKHKTKGKDK